MAIGPGQSPPGGIRFQCFQVVMWLWRNSARAEDSFHESTLW